MIDTKNPDYIENYDEFLCELCPLVEECPFDGEWNDCKVHEMITEYESLIASMSHQMATNEAFENNFTEPEIEKAMEAYKESLENEDY